MSSPYLYVQLLSSLSVPLYQETTKEPSFKSRKMVFLNRKRLQLIFLIFFDKFADKFSLVSRTVPKNHEVAVYARKWIFPARKKG